MIKLAGFIETKEVFSVSNRASLLRLVKLKFHIYQIKLIQNFRINFKNKERDCEKKILKVFKGSKLSSYLLKENGSKTKIKIIIFLVTWLPVGPDLCKISPLRQNVKNLRQFFEV